jgi:hypothetical protein
MRTTCAALALGMVLACGDSRVAGSDDAAAIDAVPLDTRSLDAMVDVPPEQVPTEVIDGLPNPSAVIYEDLGQAALDAPFRALLGFPLRDEGALNTSVRDIYTPGNARFRQYMSKDDWMTAHASLEIGCYLNLVAPSGSFRLRLDRDCTYCKKLLVTMAKCMAPLKSSLCQSLLLIEFQRS